jgi:phage terminase small subunit
MPKRKTPDPRHRIFIREYLKDKNGARAARAAGFKASSAREIARQLLTRLDIKEKVDRAIDEQAKKCDITAERVIKRIAQIALEKKKVRDSDALKGCELLGKHFKLFTEMQETKVTAAVSVATPEQLKDAFAEAEKKY